MVFIVCKLWGPNLFAPTVEVCFLRNGSICWQIQHKKKKRQFLKLFHNNKKILFMEK